MNNETKSSGLNDFIANVKTGLSKTSHFDVIIARPPALQGEPINSNMRKIFMFCDQAQLPSTAFSSNQVRSYGEFKDVPYEKLYENINLSFYVDSNFMVKNFFDSWMNSIQDPVTRDFKYAKTYLAPTIEIIVQDSEHADRYKCTLYNAYPKSIGAVQLDYASKDVMKLQVSIVYEYAVQSVLANYNKVADANLAQITPALPSFGYGNESFTDIPKNYFSDFQAFQDQIDFTTGAVQSLLSMESLNELTGFGGVFI